MIRFGQRWAKLLVQALSHTHTHTPVRVAGEAVPEFGKLKLTIMTHTAFTEH